MSKKRIGVWINLVLIVFLAACGTAARDATQTEFYTIGGIIKGLAGVGLELRNRANNDLLPFETHESTGGELRFEFKQKLENGANYEILVHADPRGSLTADATPIERWQTCSVSHGTGQIRNADVRDVEIVCVNKSFALAGQVTGLDRATTGITLRYTSGDRSVTAVVAQNGAFQFEGLVDSGEAYHVSVVAPPSAPAQYCGVNNAQGIVLGSKVENIQVLCSTQAYKVVVNVVGQRDSGLAFSINDYVPPLASTNARVESTPLPYGLDYRVAVSAHPAYQTCIPSPARGVIGTADAMVTITCKTNTHRLRGVVHGLVGTGFSIRNTRSNGNQSFTNTLVIAPAAAPNAAGSDINFEFDEPIEALWGYVVSIATQPGSPTQNCALRTGTERGTMLDVDIGSVVIDCTTLGYKIGGVINGLQGTVELGLNANRQTFTGNGAPINFSFDNTLASGVSYNITVATNPLYAASGGLSQTCHVDNLASGASSGNGTVGGADISSVSITCETNRYSVSGTVSGLASAANLTVKNPGKTDITVTGSGAQTFAFADIPSGGGYDITTTSPAGQECRVSGAKGSVTDQSITNVMVTCAYILRVNVSGLATTAGTKLTLKNGADTLDITANGTFPFTTALAEGASYAISATDPNGQRCSVPAAGSGKISRAVPAAIAINCAYRLQVTVDGLASNRSLTVINGTNSLTFAASGTQEFPALATSAGYNVVIPANGQPDGQNCSIANGAGTVGTTVINAIPITCAYFVSGTLTNLAAGKTVVLKNGTETLPLTANATFTFNNTVAAGQATGYTVTVATQPGGQVCNVTNGSGATTGAIINNVVVDCKYVISGSVVSLDSTMPISLRNNLSDQVNRTGNGSFLFPIALSSGSSYDVTVLTAPSGRQCSVTNGKGTVGSSVIDNIVVNCSTLSLFVGNMGGPGNVDGNGTAARFDFPVGITLDGSGNSFIADSGNHVIRKMAANGAVTTWAGVSRSYGTLDGSGISARFNSPQDIAIDRSGNLYVADMGNNAIRKITPAGVVSTFAGSKGIGGFKDGASSIALFQNPFGVACDAVGNVYVADTGNNVIRKITPAGDVSTLAGSAGLLGTDDGQGDIARFDSPRGLAVDSVGNVFVADTNNSTIRKITPQGLVSTFAGLAKNSGSNDGAGTLARFSYPSKIAIDTSNNLNNLFVTDSGDYLIRKITDKALVSTIAGTANLLGTADGVGSAARFSYPAGIAINSQGVIYLTDAGASTVRKIDTATSVTTIAGEAAKAGFNEGLGAGASFSEPQGVVVDAAGIVTVVDMGNFTIRRITPQGTTSGWLGTARAFGSADGTGGGALFNYPTGIALDATGNAFILDTNNQTLRKSTAQAVVTTLAGSVGISGALDATGTRAQFYNPQGVAVAKDGTIYVVDTWNSTIRAVSPSGVVTTLAGLAATSGAVDGAGNSARFNYPMDIAIDSKGVLYVADMWNNAIRKVTPQGAVSTWAGRLGWIGTTDGNGQAARFFAPRGITVDSADNVYVADTENGTLRKITPAGDVTTIMGIPGTLGFRAGAAPGLLGKPQRIAVYGNKLYVTLYNGIAVIDGIP